MLRCAPSIPRLSVASASAPGGPMARTSLALSNLRAIVILIVLAFHSVLAYPDSLPAKARQFDTSPYEWQATPIVDSQRWLGFDLFCAWHDVYLMSLMFFLSGLFVWTSLMRKGSGPFVPAGPLRPLLTPTHSGV